MATQPPTGRNTKRQARNAAVLRQQRCSGIPRLRAIRSAVAWDWRVTGSPTPERTNADAHVAAANAALAEGRRDAAIAGYREALAAQPGHPVATLQLAGLIFEHGVVDDDLEGAIEVCRAAIKLLPQPGSAQALLARLLLAAGRAEEAVAAYRLVVTAAPGDLAAWNGLAQSLLAAGDLDEALAATDAALAISPASPDALYVRGSALLRLRQPEAALAAFQQGVAAAPNQPRLHIGLGDAYAELDRDRESIAALSRAVALDPVSKWAHANLGSMLYRTGDLEGAELHCRAALAADPAMAMTHRNLAGILAAQGRTEEARHHRDAAFQLANVFVARAPHPRVTVLALTTADTGNVPHRFLLPIDRFTRIDWFIEYARDGQAAELPPYDVVFNIVGDPDHAGRTAEPIAVFVAEGARPVLNDPARVARTRRDRLPTLLADVADVVVPKVARFEAEAARDPARAVAAAGLTWPLLIRPIGSHGGRGLALAEAPAALDAEDLSGGFYATEFVDFRSASDGLYRKYRVIFVDRVAYPYHLAISPGWLVHYATADMEAAARRGEELRFLADPASALGARAMAAIAEIGRRLDLDYAGVDFSVLADGQVLVFEANATMLVHPETDPAFAYKNSYVERITGAFQALVDRLAAA
jgi:tetratricopeptide (TPR) repeat protein